MTFSLTSPITGAAQTGFTTPTYTHVADTAPDVNGRQVAITALGGTQAGVTVHSVASPFSITFFRPKAYKVGKDEPGDRAAAQRAHQQLQDRHPQGCDPTGWPAVQEPADHNDLRDPGRIGHGRCSKRACGLLGAHRCPHPAVRWYRGHRRFGHHVTSRLHGSALLLIVL